MFWCARFLAGDTGAHRGTANYLRISVLVLAYQLPCRSLWGGRAAKPFYSSALPLTRLLLASNTVIPVHDGVIIYVPPNERAGRFGSLYGGSRRAHDSIIVLHRIREYFGCVAPGIRAELAVDMTRLFDIGRRVSSRYPVLLMRRAVGRSLEFLRYRLVVPRGLQRFHIVSAQRNMGEAAVACLRSVFHQRYPHELVRHVFIDDASTDNTPSLIEHWLSGHPDHRVEFIRNSERLGMLANNMMGFEHSVDSDIGIELNGDDWLPDGGVLRFLNKVYNDPGVWMTYNTVRRTDGIIPLPLAPKKRVTTERSFRSAPWATSALHTFRIPLYRHLSIESLIDPETREPWMFSQDQAVYLPMLEMAGSHARHIYRVTLTYNFHEHSDENVNRPEQLRTSQRIRSMPPYVELSSLGQ